MIISMITHKKTRIYVSYAYSI